MLQSSANSRQSVIQFHPPHPRGFKSPASAAANVERWTFDGGIRNNSLAVSPDESTAVVSYSERPDVIVYDLRTGKVRSVVHGYVALRNIVFAPSGNAFYISDSSLGTVTRVDSQSLEATSRLPLGAGAFGTTISKDGKTLYVNNQASSTVTTFDLDAEQPRTVITGFAQPRQAIVFTHDAKSAYVLNEDLSLSKVDLASNQIVGTMSSASAEK